MLQVERHSDDVLLGRIRGSPAHEGVAQSKIAHALLAARVDYGPDTNRADAHVRGEQACARELQGNGAVAVFRMLAV